MNQDCNYNMCYVVNGNKWTKIYNNKTRICDNKTLAAINREKCQILCYYILFTSLLMTNQLHQLFITSNESVIL